MKEQIRRAEEDAEYFFEEGCFILELANTADDPDLSIARARVRPNVTTKLHRLAGVVERYVILAGRGRVEIGGLPAQEVFPHDVVIIPPQCPQRITNIGNTDLVFLAICTPRFTRKAYRNIETKAVPGSQESD